MKAVIIGATGATGAALVQQCLDDDYFDEVRILVRRASGIEHIKLKEYIINFDTPESWKNLVEGDIAFSAMGTTLKQAGSKEAQWKIDYTYQYQFALSAKENNISCFVLVSAQNANAQSSLFYVKMKGQLDEAIQKLGFPRLILFKPPLLDRPNSDRGMEKMALKFILGLNKLGILKSQAALKTSDLAAAMIASIKRRGLGIETWSGQKIRQLLDR